MLINISPGFYHNQQKMVKFLRIFQLRTLKIHIFSQIILKNGKGIYWPKISDEFAHPIEKIPPFREDGYGHGIRFGRVCVCVCACGKFAGLQPDRAIIQRSYCRSLREALLSWPMLESVRTSGRIIAEVEEQYLLIKDFNNEIWKR